MTFEPDAALAAAFADVAGECAELAQRIYKIELDYSDESIKILERMADQIHQSQPKHPADPGQFERQLIGLSNDIGAYLGETFRRNHGGSWGKITDDSGAVMPGLQSNRGQLFWPTGRARNRLMSGAEDNLWHYYRYLVDAEDDNMVETQQVTPRGLRLNFFRRRR